MMGSTEDPEDGGAVAAAVFGAVAIYGVSQRPWQDTNCYVETSANVENRLS